MKKIIFVSLLLLGSFFSFSQTEVTTYYLIRHAEKNRTDSTNHNPNLTKKGLERAQKWAEIFSKVHFDKIYSTNYNRTLQTAQPTATEKKLKIQFYNPRKIYDDQFKKQTKGKSVLIIGHSNTTPKFVNKIIGSNKYKDIDDHNNANLYIVTVVQENRTSILLKIE